MPEYQNAKEVLSGVPLGAIGAGKMEILPNGLFNAFSFLNNWSQPITGGDSYPGILGYHMAVYAEPVDPAPGAAGSRVWLLQSEKLADWPLMRDIAYDGRYP